MVEKKKKESLPEQPHLKLNKELKQVYMTGALGGYTSHDFRLLIFNEKPVDDTEQADVINLVRDINHEIIMSHSAVKELYNWLGKQIKEFEEKIEELKSEESKSDNEKPAKLIEV